MRHDYFGAHTDRMESVDLTYYLIYYMLICYPDSLTGETHEENDDRGPHGRNCYPFGRHGDVSRHCLRRISRDYDRTIVGGIQIM